MNSEISHRGPDNSGFGKTAMRNFLWSSKIINFRFVFCGQPMHSNSGRYILTYNGEVYNHIEVRKELEELNIRLFGEETQILRQY